ncbi:MAG: glycosyltransferase [Desulfomonile sp.]|nr:glycosyltransferase [Desulfomonile sp.]
MRLTGLVISQADATDTSAYSHRVNKLAQCLEERGIRIDFLYMEDSPPLNIEIAASVCMLLWLRTLRKYDFIYAGCEGAGQSLYFCRPFLKGPILYDIHGDPLAQSALSREIKTGRRITTASLRVRIEAAMALACADHVITVCKPHTETLVREGKPADRVSIIRNGVDLDLFQKLSFPERPQYTFAYIGAFQNWQGIDNLARAFELVRNPEIKLLIVGFSPADNTVKRAFAEKFGPRVELVDRTDRQTLVSLVKNAGVLMIPRIAHPAVRHAFPTKFAEYAAMGRPIWVNDVDETADFVRRYDCGFVSDPSPEEMARGMERTAALPTSELAEMGRRARHMAEENFSWPIIGDAYAELVQKVVDRYRSKK